MIGLGITFKIFTAKLGLSVQISSQLLKWLHGKQQKQEGEGEVKTDQAETALWLNEENLLMSYLILISLSRPLFRILD